MNTLASHIDSYIHTAKVYEKEIGAEESKLNHLLIQIFKDIESLNSSQTDKRELHSLLNRALSKLNTADMQKHKRQLFRQIQAAFHLDSSKIKEMDNLKDPVDSSDKKTPLSPAVSGVQQPRILAAQPLSSYLYAGRESQPGVAQPHPQPAKIPPPLVR
ncbi:hypothetical protein PARA125_000355 [Parachlamydia sp. AcF125]|nr:hypothetical protein [Parachlamydia sp. AcF125]